MYVFLSFVMDVFPLFVLSVFIYVCGYLFL